MRKYVLIILLTASLIGITGCKSIPKSGANQLRKNFVLLRKDYKKYLDKDPKFDENPEGKADRLGLIDDSVKLIDEAVK